MKIENITGSKNKGVTVSFTHIDNAFKIVIGSGYYKDWLFVNNLTHSEISLINFAEEYLSGVITTDNTGQILAKDILKIAGKTFEIGGYSYDIHKSRYGLYVYRDGKRISHQELVDLYRATLELRKPCLN